MVSTDEEIRELLGKVRAIVAEFSTPGGNYGAAINSFVELVFSLKADDHFAAFDQLKDFANGLDELAAGIAEAPSLMRALQRLVGRPLDPVVTPRPPQCIAARRSTLERRGRRRMSRRSARAVRLSFTKATNNPDAAAEALTDFVFSNGEVDTGDQIVDFLNGLDELAAGVDESPSLKLACDRVLGSPRRRHRLRPARRCAVRRPGSSSRIRKANDVGGIDPPDPEPPSRSRESAPPARLDDPTGLLLVVLKTPAPDPAALRALFVRLVVANAREELRGHAPREGCS